MKKGNAVYTQVVGQFLSGAQGSRKILQKNDAAGYAPENQRLRRRHIRPEMLVTYQRAGPGQPPSGAGPLWRDGLSGFPEGNKIWCADPNGTASMFLHTFVTYQWEAIVRTLKNKRWA